MQGQTEPPPSGGALTVDPGLSLQLLDGLAGLVYLYDLAESRFVYANRAMLEFLGCPAERLQAMGSGAVAGLVHPDDAGRVMQHHARIRQDPGASALPLECRWRRADGQIRWVCVQDSVLVRGKDGLPARIAGMASDITDRRQAEDAMRIREERFRLALEGTRDSLWDWDLATGMIFRDRTWFSMLGYPEREELGDVEQVRALLHPEDRDRVVRASRAAIEQGGAYEVEARLRCADGSWRWVASRGHVSSWGPDRKPNRISGLNTDIQHRKQAEELLAKRDAQLRESQAAARIGNWTWDLLENTLEWSDQTSRLFDLDPGVFRPSMDYFVGRIHPDDLPIRNAALQAALGTRTPYHSLVRMINESGRTWVMEAFGGVEYGRNGEPIRISGTAQDVTARRRAEEDLIAAKEKAEAGARMFKAITDQATEGIALADLDGHYQFVNPAFCGMSGYSQEELLSMTVFDLARKAGPGQGYYENRAQAEGKVISVTLRCKDGGEKSVEIIGKQIIFNDRKVVLGTVRDMTERRRAEDALRESENLFNSAFQFLPVGLGITTFGEGKVLSVNRHYTDTFGYTMEDLRGRSSLDLGVWVRPEDRDEIIARIRGGSPVLSCEVQLRKKDGTLCWASFSGCQVMIKGVPCLLSVTDDITQRKRTTDALRESDQRFTEAFQFMPIGTAIGSLKGGRLLAVNRFFAEIFGYGERELLGESSLQLGLWADPGDRAGVVARVERGEPVYSLEARFRRRDGTTGWMSYSGCRITLLDEDYLLSAVVDVTERRRQAEENARLQAQFQQSQKMESLGVLSGGIAHDMNNVLGAILSLASANLQLQAPGTPAFRTFETIAKAATRGGEMVKSLLTFARKSHAEARPLDLNAILREEVRLLERTTFSKVRLELDLEPDLLPMLGDPSGLAHVFMNLCVNAVDAMPDSGVLTLRTRNLGPDRIEACVEDTGHGMTPEILDRAMDPFFTTKGVGQGTGLGLSMVYSTVKAHHGQISLSSTPGQGTRARLQFPASASGPGPVEETAQEPGVSAHPKQILLVDDDELIQGSLGPIIESLGHTVEACLDGEEALARIESGLRPDLVILDMNMPGLGGAGTLPRLRGLLPAVPVLLSTGRADQAALDLVKTHASVTLLAKPFSIQELQRCLDV